MKFTVIDKENWDRKEYFEHFFLEFHAHIV